MNACTHCTSAVIDCSNNSPLFLPLRSDVISFLRTCGTSLNKNLGQHFLIDEQVLATIIETAQLQSADHIVEIGPGMGILTRELLKHAGNVTAIEIDRRFIPLLHVYLAADPDGLKISKKLTIIEGNALHVDFPALPYKIVANIPYHITSPLLRHALLESRTAPTSLTLLIQREVAEKIVDPDDGNLLSILVNLFGKAHIACIVPPSCFLPRPEVDSAVLHIDCFATPLADRDDVECILYAAKHAFSQKRKMLRRTIGLLPSGLSALELCGIDPERRPQTLSIEEWMRLARSIDQKNS